MNSLMLTKGQHFSCQMAQHHVFHCKWINLIPRSQTYAHVTTAPEKQSRPALMLPCEWTTHVDIMKEVLLVLHVSWTPQPQGIGKTLNKFSQAKSRCLKATTVIFCKISSYKFTKRETLRQKLLSPSLGKMKTETKGLSGTLQTVYKTTAKENKCRK